MRRPLARHAFTALSLLSLLLCIAMCVLWVRSYRVTDVVSDNGITLLSPATTLASNRGRVRVDHLGPLAAWPGSTAELPTPPPPGMRYTTTQPYIMNFSLRSWSGPGIKANGEIGGFEWFWATGGQVSPP